MDHINTSIAESSGSGTGKRSPTRVLENRASQLPQFSADELAFHRSQYFTLQHTQSQLSRTGVAVEKLLPAKFAKIKSRQEAPQSIFSDWVDIFYSPNCGCLAVWSEKGVFQQPRDVTTATAAAPLQQGRLLLSALEAEPNTGDGK